VPRPRRVRADCVVVRGRLGARGVALPCGPGLGRRVPRRCLGVRIRLERGDGRLDLVLLPLEGGGPAVATASFSASSATVATAAMSRAWRASSSISRVRRSRERRLRRHVHRRVDGEADGASSSSSRAPR